MQSPAKFIRILIVEDDHERINRFKLWLPEWVRPVLATSAGKAMDIIERDGFRKNNGRDVFAGIMLDHDLEKQATLERDLTLDGSDIVVKLAQNIRNDVPILIHSMNPGRAPLMVQYLEDAGFSVTRIPMNNLSMEKFTGWLQEVRELWEEMQE